MILETTVVATYTLLAALTGIAACLLAPASAVDMSTRMILNLLGLEQDPETPTRDRYTMSAGVKIWTSHFDHSSAVGPRTRPGFTLTQLKLAGLSSELSAISKSQ